MLVMGHSCLSDHLRLADRPKRLSQVLQNLGLGHWQD